MRNVLNQFRRIYDDNGRNDKSFDLEETRLRQSLLKLKQATRELIRASQSLHDLLTEKQPRKYH